MASQPAPNPWVENWTSPLAPEPRVLRNPRQVQLVRRDGRKERS
jgi:hypothetical protein